MKKKVILKLELQLCDRNRNFDEIINSVYSTIKERDGVDKLKVLDYWN